MTLERLSEQMDGIAFGLDGWRLLAYWLAVNFIGVSIGVYYGHPDPAVPVLGDAIAYPVTPDTATARAVANGMGGMAFACLMAVLGREAFIEAPDGDTDG